MLQLRCLLARPLPTKTAAAVPAAARRASSSIPRKSNDNLTSQQGGQRKTGFSSISIGVVVGALGVWAWYERDGHGLNLQRQRSRTYASEYTTSKGLDEIRRQLGEDAVSTDFDDLEEHGHSEWSTSNTTVRPRAVVWPSSTEEVAAVARVCHAYRIPMVPYGAGSSVEGNFSAPHGGVCIDLSRMDKVVAFHPDDLDVVVQAGVNWTALNDMTRDSGLFLPLDPSPTATIGGMVATNCSGTNAMRYGTMKDYVLGLTVVLADGTIVKTRHRPRKTSAGYNLTALFTGSEGTLGIITEATLKLATIPPRQQVATATFLSVRDAASAASDMIRKGINLAALELMDDVQMRVVNSSGGAGSRVLEEAPTLFIKFSGTDKIIQDSVGAAQQVAKSFRCRSFVSSSNEDDMASLWSARKQALWACLATRPEGTEIWSTDVAVPISRLAGIIDECKEESSKLGLFSSVLGHVGDGNFHQMIMYNPKKPEEKAAVKKFVEDMMQKAIQMEGTVSGEHGIGLGKKQCLLQELSPATVGVMRAFKESIDPHWLMNPGKIFDEGQ